MPSCSKNCFSSREIDVAQGVARFCSPNTKGKVLSGRYEKSVKWTHESNISCYLSDGGAGSDGEGDFHKFFILHIITRGLLKVGRRMCLNFWWKNCNEKYWFCNSWKENWNNKCWSDKKLTDLKIFKISNFEPFTRKAQLSISLSIFI